MTDRPRRIREVPCPLLVDDDLSRREHRRDVADPAGMIQVNVRDHDRGQVTWRDPERGERGLHDRGRGRRPRLNQAGPA